jgi:hypothetical protein
MFDQEEYKKKIALMSQSEKLEEILRLREELVLTRSATINLIAVLDESGKFDLPTRNMEEFTSFEPFIEAVTKRIKAQL